jgi:hypothetical protein
MSKIFRTRPERSRLAALGEMREQLQFSVRVLNARLSDQTPTSEEHGRGRGSCQGSRPLRGAQYAALTQAFTPRPISPPCGECASVALGETSRPKTRPRPPGS